MFFPAGILGGSPQLTKQNITIIKTIFFIPHYNWIIPCLTNHNLEPTYLNYDNQGKLISHVQKLHGLNEINSYQVNLRAKFQSSIVHIYIYFLPKKKLYIKKKISFIPNDIASFFTILATYKYIFRSPNIIIFFMNSS